MAETAEAASPHPGKWPSTDSGRVLRVGEGGGGSTLETLGISSSADILPQTCTSCEITCPMVTVTPRL